MPTPLAVWILGIAFCAAWITAVYVVYRTGWNRICPRLAGWMTISALQSVLTTCAGPLPSASWTLHVWVPIEALVMIALGAAIVEAFPLMAISALLGASLVALPISWLLFHAQTGWYSAFLDVREWWYLAAAIAITFHVVTLMLWPRKLLPAVYRARCILMMALIASACIGPIITVTGEQWISARSVYRVIMTLCCVRWAMLAPRMQMAKYSA